MSKDYRLYIYETWREDDYEQGEIGGYFTNDLTDEKHFDTPEEALKSFADRYGIGKMYKLDDGDGRTRFGFSATMKIEECGFREMTEQDIESWKQGKLKGYNVEWIAMIIKETVVDQVNENALPFPIEQA